MTFIRTQGELAAMLGCGPTGQPILPPGKVGTAPHTNNFGLGETGRPRSNVWGYPGVSSLGSKRAEALAMHPTVKPVALVADAIRDCSQRGEIVLDSFGGSGMTLIAAETCGRQARLIEYDGAYCDTIIARWQRFSGKPATLEGDGRSFDAIADERLGARTADARALSSVQPRSKPAPRARPVLIPRL